MQDNFVSYLAFYFIILHETVLGEIEEVDTIKDDVRIMKLRLELEYLEWQIHQQIDVHNNLNEYKLIQRKLTKIYRENSYKF